MIRNIALVVATIIIAGAYFYITLQNNRIQDLAQDKVELSDQVASLKRQVIFEQQQLEKSTLLYKEYLDNLNKIKPRTITVYRDIVKELPADVVVEKANEDSNEIIDSIVLNAINFSWLHNPEAGASSSSSDTANSTTTPKPEEAGMALSTQ